MLIRPYLRASTENQNAERAKKPLKEWINSQNIQNNTNHRIASWYIENATGKSLKRNELNRLLDDSEIGDVLLVESVDRLSRLNESDWKLLVSEIDKQGIFIVSVDLPTSHQVLFNKNKTNEYVDSVLKAVNSMLLDILAATARKDLLDRDIKREQGIEIAKRAGKYKGRIPNKELHSAILKLSKPEMQMTIEDICKALNTSHSTVCRVRRNAKNSCS